MSKYEQSPSRDNREPYSARDSATVAPRSPKATLDHRPLKTPNNNDIIGIISTENKEKTCLACQQLSSLPTGLRSSASLELNENRVNLIMAKARDEVERE